MDQKKEKDFAEKIIRLRPKCCKELKISPEKLSMDNFLKWLVDRILKYEENNNDN